MTSRKFKKFSRTLERVVKAQQVQAEAVKQLHEELEADRDELIRRDKRRAYLAGSWLLARHREWFDHEAQRASFVEWAEEVPSRADDLSLFDRDADDDFLTADRVAEFARKAGAAGLFDAAGGGGKGSRSRTRKARMSRQPAVESDPHEDADASELTAGESDTEGSSGEGGPEVVSPPVPAS